MLSRNYSLEVSMVTSSIIDFWTLDEYFTNYNRCLIASFWQSTVKLLYLFDVLSQIGESKILAIIPAIIKLMQCSNKISSQDFDCGQRSEYTAYASDTPLINTKLYLAT